MQPRIGHRFLRLVLVYTVYSGLSVPKLRINGMKSRVLLSQNRIRKHPIWKWVLLKGYAELSPRSNFTFVQSGQWAFFLCLNQIRSCAVWSETLLFACSWQWVIFLQYGADNWPCQNSRYIMWSILILFLISPWTKYLFWILTTSRKHAYIILTPLNPTFI